jgi:hypothetical protein
VLVDREPLADRFHFEASAAPDADTIYTDMRPTHSGPHTVQTTPVSPDGYSRQIDERSLDPQPRARRHHRLARPGR